MHKKLGLITLLAVVLMASTLFGGLGAQEAVAAPGPVTAFLGHPDRCLQLLGDNHDSGDVLPPAFHTDLEAALDASVQPAGMSLRQEAPFLQIVFASRVLPADQAIVKLNTRCKQRLGRA